MMQHSKNPSGCKPGAAHQVASRRALRKAATLSIGDVIGGHYVVDELLAEGGMAVVYRARNAATGKPCAVKVLQAQLGERPEFVQLFAKEARISSVVGDNAHIVDVYDAGLDEARGIHFIVMRLLEGETLEQALQRGPLPRSVAQAVLEQLGEALEQAHNAGVVHRDLKPSNLFLIRTDDGEPFLKVMDFGIAKVLEVGGALRTATQIGTPAYTAPEQMGSTTRKLAAKQGITISAGVSPATDVWAIGLLAYEMFTGALPGQYWGIETLTELPMKVAFEEVEPASVRAGGKASLLPAGFDAWFARCLRKNAAERWATAGKAVSELVELMGAQPAPSEAAETTRRSVGAPALTAHSLPTLPKLPSVSSPSITVAAGPAAVMSLTGADRQSVQPVVRRVGGDQARRTAPSRWAYVIGGGAIALGLAGWFTYDAYRQASAEESCLATDGHDQASVASHCERACEAGSVASCAQLGALHERGDGVERDETRARELYQRACGMSATPGSAGAASASSDGTRRWISEAEAAGCPKRSCSPHACASLASFYEDGRGGLPKNKRIATALYKRVCSLRHDDEVARGAVGCIGLGAQRERAGQPAAALAYHQLACDEGLHAGCLRLARLLERGDERGVEQDEKRARVLYQKICDEGNMKGCTLVGKMVEHGKGGWVADVPAAVALYKRACEGGELLGCSAFATAHLVGKGGLPQDAVRARELLQGACDGGELTSCAQLATMTAQGIGGLTADEKRAFDLNKRACEGGALLGCANLGTMYIQGQAGLSNNETEGRSLLERACRGGEAAGCVALGEMAESGERGSSQDLAQAAVLYRRACDEGAMRGCTNLANLVYQGIGGMEKDAQQSVALNNKACSGGDQIGCVRLGILSVLGHGVAKDQGRAAKLFKSACATAAEATTAMQSRCSMLGDLIRGSKDGG